MTTTNLVIVQRDSVTLESNKPSANLVIQPTIVNDLGIKFNYQETITLESNKPNVIITVEHKGQQIEAIIEKNSGLDGREIELRKTSTHIQWSYKNSEEWVNLISLSELVTSSEERGWIDYVSHWSEQPTQIAIIDDGIVFTYVLDSVTRYRLVPDPYLPENDAFYENWNGTILSDLIVSRA